MENNTHTKSKFGKSRIVIIDDEVDLCFLLSSMLKKQGFEVYSFYNLKEGLTGIKELLPDWVVIDNNLPDGLGWEHVNEIIESAPSINVIKISANPDSYRGKPREFVHYLIKPIDVNSISSLISGDGSSTS